MLAYSSLGMWQTTEALAHSLKAIERSRRLLDQPVYRPDPSVPAKQMMRGEADPSRTNRRFLQLMLALALSPGLLPDLPPASAPSQSSQMLSEDLADPEVGPHRPAPHRGG
jgi:hypothetical protein